MSRRIGLGFLLLVITLLAGCFFPSPIDPEILYDESFGSEASWYVGEAENSEWWLGEGKYHVLVKGTNSLSVDHGYSSWRRGVGPFGNFLFLVDTEQISGPENNGYGIQFRMQDGDNYYRFRISGDGWAKFDKNVAGVRTTLRSWEETPLVNKGNAANQIGVLAEGSTFTFYINGDVLYTETDTSFASGYIGLSVIKYDSQSDLHVTFDNLIIQALE